MTYTSLKEAIIAAAIKDAAFRPEQIYNVLKTRIVETAMGEWVITIPPEEAVQHLKQRETDEYGSVFKALPSSNSNPNAINVRNMTREQYLELRRTNPEALGFKPVNAAERT